MYTYQNQESLIQLSLSQTFRNLFFLNAPHEILVIDQVWEAPSEEGASNVLTTQNSRGFRGALRPLGVIPTHQVQLVGCFSFLPPLQFQWRQAGHIWLQTCFVSWQVNKLLLFFFGRDSRRGR